MVPLPQELIDRISSYLSNEELKRTLTVNRAFNAAAERLSGAFVSFKLTEDNLQDFLTVCVGSRFRHLREVEFSTQFAPILYENNGRLACRETKEDLRQKDEQFSSQIKRLFSTLKSAESEAGDSGLGRFKLIIYGPTRNIARELSRICRHHKHISWRVRLLAVDTLPELRCVHSLHVNQGQSGLGPLKNIEISKLDLRVIPDLAKKLPNLEFMECQLGQDETCPKYIERSKFLTHYEHDWEGPRRDTRLGFAEAIETWNPSSSIKRVRLDFLENYDEQLRALDQEQNLPDLKGAATRDPFSISLCTLSHNLRVLELRGILDSGMFQHHDNDLAIWPNLESLLVMFWPFSPSGEWYFHGPNGEGKQNASYPVAESHYPPLCPDTNDVVHDEYLAEYGHPDDYIVGGSGFRIVPDEAVIVPFLSAFANAATNMPNLKDANLWSPLVWYQNDEEKPEWVQYEDLNDRDLAWGIAYDRPTKETPRKLTWRVSTWRPDERLHSMFRDIGRKEHGDELEEDWTDDQSGDGIVERQFFSDYEVMPRQ